MVRFKARRTFSKRRAVAGILAALMLFSMMFTVGLGYFLFINASNGNYDTELATRVSMMQDQLQENLRVTASQGGTNTLTITVTNLGGLGANAVAIFVTDSSGTVHSFGASFPSNTNPPLPLPVSVGKTTSSVDTGISMQPGTYVVKVLTQRGSAFTTTYPQQPQVDVGGIALSTKIVASPSPLYEGQTATVKVTVYNYASSAATGVLPKLDPAVVTGTATVDPCSGTCPVEGSQSIPASSNRNFTYSYVVHTGGSGGTASWTGYSAGTISGVLVSSAWALSGPIQIGGFAGAFTGFGPFNINYFFFEYTGNNHQTLTSAGSIAHNEQYVAFYVQITNEYNQPVKLLKYSFLQVVRTGPEQDFFIVKQVNLAPNPDTLTAYNLDQNSNPSDPNWITVNPGQSIQVSFAASNWGGTSFSWSSSSFASGTEADSVMVIVAYLLNGQVYAQALPFEGLIVL